MLNISGLPPLLQILNDSEASATLFQCAAATVTNLCRGKNDGGDAPDFMLVSEALPTLTRLLYHLDGEIVTSACWALFYLSTGKLDKIQKVVEAGPVGACVSLSLSLSLSLVPTLVF